jgi:hypothetical protein
VLQQVFVPDARSPEAHAWQPWWNVHAVYEPEDPVQSRQSSEWTLFVESTLHVPLGQFAAASYHPFTYVYAAAPWLMRSNDAATIKPIRSFLANLTRSAFPSAAFS